MAITANKRLLFLTKVTGLFEASIHFGFLLIALVVILHHLHHHDHHNHEIKQAEIMKSKLLSNGPSVFPSNMMNFEATHNNKAASHHVPVHIFWMRIFKISPKPHSISKDGEVKSEVPANPKMIVQQTNMWNNKNQQSPVKTAVATSPLFPFNFEHNGVVSNPHDMFDSPKTIFSKLINMQRELIKMRTNGLNEIIKSNNKDASHKVGMDVQPLPPVATHHAHHHHTNSHCHNMFAAMSLASGIYLLITLMMLHGVSKRKPSWMIPFIVIHFGHLLLSIVTFIKHMNYLRYAKYFIANSSHHVPFKYHLLAMDNRLLSLAIMMLVMGYLLLKLTIGIVVYLCYKHIVMMNIEQRNNQNADSSLDNVTINIIVQDEKKDSEKGLLQDDMKLPLYSESEAAYVNVDFKENVAKVEDDKDEKILQI